MLPEREPSENSFERNGDGPEKRDVGGRGGPGPDFTEVPNAHASGIGSMGRNDEKLPSPDDDEFEREGDDPAY